MNYVNLTPHPINVMWPDGRTRFVVERSGMIARCEEERIIDSIHDNVEWRRPQYGEVYCRAGETECPFPDPVEDTAYIVSGVVLTAMLAAGRTDCVRPDGLVRNENGQPIGCTGFSVV